DRNVTGVQTCALPISAGNRLIGGLVALGLVLLLVTTVIVMCVAMSSKFRISHVEQIAVGDSRERVIEVLGEPYARSENTFEYYKIGRAAWREGGWLMG